MKDHFMVFAVFIIGTVCLVSYYLWQSYRQGKVIEAKRASDEALEKSCEALLPLAEAALADIVVPRITIQPKKSRPDQTFREWHAAIPDKVITVARLRLLVVADKLGYRRVNAGCTVKSWKYKTSLSPLVAGNMHEDMLGQESPSTTLFFQEMFGNRYHERRLVKIIEEIAIRQSIINQVGGLRTIQVPEPVVQLPVPAWCWSSCGIRTVCMFESEAKAAIDGYSADFVRSVMAT